MSFDPFGYQEPTPPASGGPRDTSESSYDARQFAQTRERVKLPAIFLITIGILNLLVGLAQTGGTIFTASQPAEKLYKTQIEQYEQLGKSFPMAKTMADELRKESPDSLKTKSVSLNVVFSGVLLVASFLVVFGGIRMLQLRSYGLCILSSIVACVPCISFTACCCAGEIVGVWSIIVLLSPDVRAVFH